MLRPLTGRSSGPSIHVARGATAALLASATLISACGSSSSPPSSSTATSTVPKAHLNTPRIELAIAQSVLQKRHIHVRVFCPAVVLQQQGRNFHCLIKRHGSSESIPVAVTQQNDSGYVTYKVE